MTHAIIGCGRVAPNHVFGAKEFGTSVNWCCDLNEEKMLVFAQAHNIENRTSDYLVLLADPTVTSVSICTDHASHAKIAIDAMAAGKDVIIEKPIAINCSQAQKILSAKSKFGRVVTVCFQHRFDPLIQEIRRLLHDGAFGNVTAVQASVQCSKDELYYSGWRGKIETEGGSTLINQGIHTLDLIVWFFDSVQILGAAQDALKFQNNFTAEDTLVATFRLDNGVLGTFLSTNTSIVEWDSYIEIIGTKGRVRFTTDFPNKIIHCDFLEDADTIVTRLEGCLQSREELPPSMNYYGVSHKDVLHNFFKAQTGEEELFISAEDGVKTLEIVEKIYRCAKKSL